MYYEEKIAVYGIFWYGRCLYVGQTLNPKQRINGHRKKFPKGRLRVFRWVSAQDANRLERQIIQAYWKRGEAKGNKTLHGAVRHDYFEPVRIKGIDPIFKCPQAAARFLGCCTASVRKALKTGCKCMAWTLGKENWLVDVERVQV